MKKSHEVLKDAFDKVGPKVVASKLNLSLPLIYKWCQEPDVPDSDKIKSGAANPLDRLEKIYEVTQDQDVINWLCQKANGYYVENTTMVKGKNYDAKMFRNIHSFIKEFSETLDTISKCYYDDNRITHDEAELIRKEWEDLKSIGEGFVCACEAGKFDKK